MSSITCRPTISDASAHRLDQQMPLPTSLLQFNESLPHPEGRGMYKSPPRGACTNSLREVQLEDRQAKARLLAATAVVSTEAEAGIGDVVSWR